MEFLPDNYESPKSNSSYMKLQDGENRIRILSAPIIGWEDWKNGKPIRFRLTNKPEKSVDPEKDIFHFWAMVVWNYNASSVQILEIKQSSIQKRLQDLSKDKDWGKPYNYDIKIIKSGSEKMTKYVVNPVPAREIDPLIMQAFNATPIDLQELFAGGDPFKTHGDYRTKSFWELATTSEAIVEECITKDQLAEITGQVTKYIDPSDRFWRESALKAFKVDNFSQIKKRHYDLLMKRIEEKKKMISEEEVPF